jgi:hypothetical protein
MRAWSKQDTRETEDKENVAEAQAQLVWVLVM